MMNIEKVKEALEEIINQDTGTWDKPVPFSILHTRALDIARDALAEFEKPSEDIDKIIERLDNLHGVEGTPGYQNLVHVRSWFDCESSRTIIEQYAESYHERRMKEAQAIIDAEPHGMIASGIAGPMSLNAQLKRCESYHAKRCAECNKARLTD